MAEPRNDTGQTPSPSVLSPASSVLGGLRVVELGGMNGQYCGKLLADMGADVIKVEPPAGEAARRVGPFAGENSEHPHEHRYDAEGALREVRVLIRAPRHAPRASIRDEEDLVTGPDRRELEKLRQMPAM